MKFFYSDYIELLLINNYKLPIQNLNTFYWKKYINYLEENYLENNFEYMGCYMNELSKIKFKPVVRIFNCHWLHHKLYNVMKKFKWRFVIYIASKKCRYDFPKIIEIKTVKKRIPVEINLYCLKDEHFYNALRLENITDIMIATVVEIETIAKKRKFNYV